MSRALGCLLVAGSFFQAGVRAQELIPGEVVALPFPDLPPTLHALWGGDAGPPELTVQLPASYTPTNRYPLLVYVPGYDGGPGGNIANARTIAGDHDWVVASLPLFKTSIDRAEMGGGIIVSFADYPLLAEAYTTMLTRLLDEVPNLDRDRSALVGFSNGAITTAILVSSHDPFILNHFRNFCLVDHGMFHLVDIHKEGARDSRYLILAGDQPDLGRELKIRQGKMQQDVATVLGVDLSFQIQEDTAHEFAPRHMAMVREWLEQRGD